MLNFLFGGRLGDVLAPRPNKKSEIWAYLKTGQFLLALRDIRAAGKDFDVNEAEEGSGLTPLHIASAGGNLDLVVELLAQGSQVQAQDARGNSALHLCALNGHRGVVEVLLRSGADPSIPNEDGQLPIELSSERFVRDLFLRDRSSIFSPVVQAQSLFAALLAQQQEEKQQQEQQHQQSQQEGKEQADMQGEALTLSPPRTPYTLVGVQSAQKPPQPAAGTSQPNSSDIDLLTATYSTPPPHPLLQHHLLAHPSQHTNPAVTPQQPLLSFNGNLNSNRKTAARSSSKKRSVKQYGTPMKTFQAPATLRSASKLSSRPHDTLNGDGSSHASKALPRSTAASVSKEEGVSEEVRVAEEAEEVREEVLHAARDTACAWQVTSEDFNLRYNFVRAIQNKNKLKDLQMYLAQEPRLPWLRLADMGGELVSNGFTGVHVAAQYDNVNALELFAAHRCSMPVEDDGDEEGEEVHRVSFWVRDLQGRTPLHIAAMHNSSRACVWLRRQMRLERQRQQQELRRLHGQLSGQEGEQEASEGGQEEEEVVEEVEGVYGNDPVSVFDPVGCFAPVDLAGLTPLGCAKLSAAKARAPPIAPLVQRALFSPGDRSILPRTPRAMTLRAPALDPQGGVPEVCSAEKEEVRVFNPYSMYSPQLQASVQASARVSEEVLVFASAEAQGWTMGMEDRCCALAPLGSGSLSASAGEAREGAEGGTQGGRVRGGSVQRGGGWRQWCFFSVLDGHGGDFCSDFLATHLPRLLPQHLLENSCEDLPEPLADLLVGLCHSADHLLAQQHRLQVHPESATSGDSGRLRLLDSSGSAAILLLVTHRHLVFGNVGDCRGCIALLKDEAAEVEVEAVQVTRDHKPQLESETARILRANAIVTQVNERTSEVHTERYAKAKLRMSRSFGDFYLKQETHLTWDAQAVTACPETHVLQRSHRDAFVLLACDGVWDVMTCAEAVSFVHRHLLAHLLSASASVSTSASTSSQQRRGSGTQRSGEEVCEEVCARICDDLIAECLHRGSRDNMTAFLVLLPGLTRLFNLHSPLVGNSNGKSDIISSSSSHSLPPPYATFNVSPRASLVPSDHDAQLLHGTSSYASAHTSSHTSSHSRRSSPRPAALQEHLHSSTGNPHSQQHQQRRSFVSDPKHCEVDVPEPPAHSNAYMKATYGNLPPHQTLPQTAPSRHSVEEGEGPGGLRGGASVRGVFAAVSSSRDEAENEEALKGGTLPLPSPLSPAHMESLHTQQDELMSPLYTAARTSSAATSPPRSTASAHYLATEGVQEDDGVDEVVAQVNRTLRF